MADQVEPQAVVPGVKPAWQSKTLWTNLVMALVALVPIEGVQDYFIQHSGVIPMVFLIVNFILRMVTKDKIQLE